MSEDRNSRIRPWGMAVLKESDDPRDVGTNRFVIQIDSEDYEGTMAPLKDATNAGLARELAEEIRSVNSSLVQARAHFEKAAKIHSGVGSSVTSIPNAETIANHLRKLVEGCERLGISVRDPAERGRMEHTLQSVDWFEEAANSFYNTKNDEAKREALIVLLKLARDTMADSGASKISLGPLSAFIDNLYNLTAAEISKLLAVKDEARGKAAKNAKAYAKGARAGFSEFLRQQIEATKKPGRNTGRAKCRVTDLPRSIEAAQGEVATMFGDDDYRVIENLEGRTVGPALKRVKQWPTQASDVDRAMEMGYREALLRLKIESETIRREKHAPGPGPESEDLLSERQALPKTSHVLKRVYDKMFPNGTP